MNRKHRFIDSLPVADASVTIYQLRRLAMTQTTSQPKRTIDSSDVARIQGAVAKPLNGQIPKGNYVGRLQRVVAGQTAPKKTK